MKALSMKSPFGQLVRDGKKTIETRKWTTSHRGLILFVCSLNPKSPESGMALCVGELVKIRDMHKDDECHACCEIYPRAKAWILKNVRPVEPFFVKGQLGLFDVPDNLICIRGEK